MKYFLILILFASQVLWAQKPIRVVKATAVQTYFVEGKSGEKSDWWLDAGLACDIYQMDKISKPTWVAFHTDIDSFRVKMKPGEQYDFVVLLNGVDSCFTRILAPEPILKYKQQSPASHDTLAFTLTSGNNIKVKVLLNGTDSLDLFFDSGANSLVLLHRAIAEKTNLLSGMAVDYKTRDYVPLPQKSTLQIGATSWKNLRVLPVSHTGQETDGHFGWDLFDGRVLEVNYDQMIFVIHSSLRKIPKGYSKLKIEYINSLFCVEGKLMVQGKKYKNRFLFDTGYQRGILLDSILMQEQHFPKDLPVIKSTTLRNGEGKVFHTKIVNCEQLHLGKSKAMNIPTQLLNTANPAQFKTHILGNELLKRFNVIYDFAEGYVYLQANQLAGMAYVDGK